MVRGENATHYFGPVYNSGESPFGLRIYSDAIDVWKVEMKLLDKDGNLAESTFNEIGESFRDTMIFRDNSIELGDYTHDRIETTQADKDLAGNRHLPIYRLTTIIGHLFFIELLNNLPEQTEC